MSSSAVYMNRGNHEDVIMNVRYGFLKEICEKYNVTKITNTTKELYNLTILEMNIILET